MNGAESLLAAITRNGIDVCFANPGTSELHFVAALDHAGGMRCVPGLFEGVLTGAADGYARMADRPASTRLHLGPGLANGLSNLHNAMRAQSPVGVAADGPRALALTGIGSPRIDRISLARTFGVEAFRSTAADEFSRHLDAGLALQGPVVIEVAL